MPWRLLRRLIRAQGGYITIGLVDPRDKGTRACPAGCDPAMIMKGLPPPRDQEHNGIARCLRCGCYWEVTPQGLIVNRKRWLEMSLGGPMETGKEKDAGV